MIPNSVKIFLLELAHFIWYIYNRIQFFIICSYYYLLSIHEQTNRISDIVTDRSDVSDFRDLRIPKHIAMSFTNEMNDLDLDSIAKLLCWSKRLGVDYITLYDDLGKLKEKQKNLIEHVERSMKALGFEKPIKSIQGLKILSKCDGRQKFLDDVKMLMKEVEPEKITLNSIQERAGWKFDPELIISFGEPLCLYGFPPWQLRLSEIISIPTHRRVPQRIFLNLLRKFSKISQREGV